MADGPVGQSFILGPVGPRRTFSLNELNQPVAVGPVDQPFTSGPVGKHERESDCKQMDRIADSPVGSTEILDQVKQTGSPIQTDFMNMGPITEPASLGDNPPSSDLGLHSLGEQWENFSTSSIDMELEQDRKSTHGSVTGRRISNSHVPPNTEEDEDINYPWTDCLLNEESDKNSSINIQENGRKIQYNDVTRCENDFNSVNSGSDGVNSDIATLADFSDDNETWVEQLPGCPIPGCQCEGRIEFMEWGSEDMTETDDSEYEDPMDRINRLYVKNYNYDLFDGMTPMTYTPPIRKGRRRRYEVRKKKETELVESSSLTSDRGFQADEESPESEPMVQPRTVVDEVIPDVRDKTDDRGRRRWTGSDRDISSDEDLQLSDRPVTESVTAWDRQDFRGPNKEYMDWDSDDMVETDDSEYAETETDISVQDDNCVGRTRTGSNADITSDEDSKLFGRPVTESATTSAGSGTDSPSDVHVKCCNEPVTESVKTAQASETEEPLVMVSTVTMALSEIRTGVCGETDISDTPAYNECFIPDRRRPVKILSDVTSDENYKLFGRPVTESATAWDRVDTDNPSEVHVKGCKRPVTESVKARASGTEEPLIMKVSSVTVEQSEIRTSVCGETDISDTPVYNECFIPDRRRPAEVSPDAKALVVISVNQWNSKDCCFGVCKKADRVNRSGIGSCWDCLCWLVWGYCASCLAAIVIKDRSHGIDLYTEESRVYTSRLV